MKLLKIRGRIIGLYADGQPVESASEGTEVVVILDNTAFYAESGGQVGDTGYLITETCQNRNTGLSKIWTAQPTYRARSIRHY
jgi:alanyl-tRNA synthetase